MQIIFKIYANVVGITEEIFKGVWSGIVGVRIELKSNMLDEQKEKWSSQEHYSESSKA